jgi:hypothetical protein
MAISRLRDGLSAFFQELPLTDRSAYSSQHTSFEAPVLLSHVLHFRDQGHIHPAKLRPPFVEACAAHAMRAKQLRDGRATFRLLQNRHDLRVAKSSILHRKSPKISCRVNSTFEYH